MKLTRVLRYTLVLYLVFPFLFLIFQFGWRAGSSAIQWPETSELFWAFKNSCLQAFFSAAASLFLGTWAALGLLALAGKRQRLRSLMEVLCLLPNFLPPLFILLATLNILDPFPMGIEGIVIIHTLMNFGLVAVLVAGLVESKLGTLTELSYVEGIPQFYFLRKVFFPLLKRDLLLIFLFVFVICFASFAIPLTVGGARGTTLEVLIYEKIRLSNRWGEAVILALLQSLFIFVLSLVAGTGKSSSTSRKSHLKLITMPTGNLVILFCSGLLMLGYWQGLLDGIKAISNLYEIQNEIFFAFLGSLVLGLAIGSWSFILLMVIAYVSPYTKLEKFLQGYVAPSTALACFCLLILGPNESFWPFLKIPLAFVMISLCSIYRMGWGRRLQILENQCQVAMTMGAPRGLIFREIIFPQVASTAGLLAGLASVWGAGDFAVSRILAHRDLSLALMSETLMASYRLNLATLLSLLVLVAGLICFVFFFWGSRVLSRKFTT